MAPYISFRFLVLALAGSVTVALVLWSAASSGNPSARGRRPAAEPWTISSVSPMSLAREETNRHRRPVPSAHEGLGKVLVSDEPQARFRDNLLSDRNYITSGHSFGSSNQLISFIKLITLALRLDRIPIIDNFAGDHHGEGTDIPVSEFYDLARLGRTINLPITEWKDVKRHDSNATEEVVCWQVRSVSEVASSSLAPFKIDVASWFIPETAFVSEIPTLSSLEAVVLKPPNPADDGGPVFDLLREALRSRDRPVPASLPDQHLLCFDQFFWVSDGSFINGRLDESESVEDPSPWGRSWQEVGQHLHFNQQFARLRDDFLAGILGRVDEGYIGVHLRQGDFLWYKKMGDNPQEDYVKAVEEVQAELHQEHWTPQAPAWAGKRRKPLPVVFATDSEDAEYIASLQARGWHYLDHAKFTTTERFGTWHPSMLDLAVLSNAAGFVG